MPKICNAADRPKQGCGRLEGLVQRCSKAPLRPQSLPKASAQAGGEAGGEAGGDAVGVALNQRLSPEKVGAMHPLIDSPLLVPESSAAALRHAATAVQRAPH